MTMLKLTRPRGRHIGLAILLVLVGSGAFAHDQDADATRVQVSWAPSETLAEVKDNPMQRGWLRPQEWEKGLSDDLRKRADQVLPAGEQLSVVIDDIKLAGAYEPWRASNAQDIRFLKELYPPRIDLHYTLSGADGAIIRSGKAKLRDMAYLQHTLPSSTDPLRYDKRLLEDWLRKEFRPDRAG